MVDLHKGSFFGEFSVLNDSPSVFTYVAITRQRDVSQGLQTKLYMIEKSHFMNLMQSFPDFECFIKYRASRRKGYFFKIVEGMKLRHAKNKIK